MKKILFAFILASFIAFPLYGIKSAQAQLSTLRSIVFPVFGSVTYYDDFGNDRDGGARSHEGNDLMGKKMLPLVAAVDGTITNVNYPEATWGMSVTIRDKDGYTYHYLHMNNDTPGTDDGMGDGFNAYAPDIQEGNKVVKGQLIGYMGDSGNAEGTPPHLHFEIRLSGTAFSPYQSLKNAAHITTIVPAPQQDNEILPYENFAGGVSVAVANLDKDSGMEYVTGAGTGGGPLVKVFDEDGDQQAAFYAYDPNFTGGIDVAAADIDDDGRAEIITAPGKGGGPHIKIFKLDGTVVKEFFAYDASFTGGVFVSAADMDGDGEAEIVTGPGAGGGPHIRVFNGAGVLQHELFAYDAGFTGGVDVAAIPASGRSSSGGFATAPGQGGGPHIKVFDENGQVDKEFFAYDGNYNLGVRIAAGDATSRNSGMEIGVIPATGGGPHAKLFSLDGEQVYSNFAAFEPWWRGGYDIALYDDAGLISSNGGRRASIREVQFRTSSRDDDDDDGPSRRRRR